MANIYPEMAHAWRYLHMGDIFYLSSDDKGKCEIRKYQLDLIIG
jgi:hypothetical protein